MNRVLRQTDSLLDEAGRAGKSANPKGVVPTRSDRVAAVPALQPSESRAAV